MARMRSPGYPGISLGQAIDLVRQIHSKSRTNVIDRESAAKDMGYSGLTGRSLMLLAALAQFDLVGRAGKGDLKVTPTAVSILHGITPQEKAAALKHAGYAPRLFRQLFERFPDGIPSENVIRSYLIQQGFADVAIGPAIKSFMETNRFLEDAGVSDSHGDQEDDDAESPAPIQPETPMQPQVTNPTPAAATGVMAAIAQIGAPVLNKINMNIQGRHVHVDAVLDYKGLLALEKKIAGLKALMAPDDDDEEITAESLM